MHDTSEPGASLGYHVDRIARAKLRPTEKVDLGHVREIAEAIQRDGVFRRPVLVEWSSFAILDGHHRFQAAVALGLGFIPAVLIDYGDPRLTLASWTERQFRPEEVLQAAASGKLLPPKSTRHILTPPIEEMPVPLADLFSPS